MTPEEAIKELREASDSEVRYGDTDNHYDEVMKRVEAFDMAIKALEQESITWIVGKDNAQVAVRNMPINKMQKICAIIGDDEKLTVENCLDDAREDFMSDVYNTLDFLPTNDEANLIIDSFDRVTSGIMQEPCEDCVSREAVKEQFEEVVHNNGSATEFLVRLWKLPSVTPTRPTGKWEYVQYDYNPNIGNWHCSECRNIVIECANKNEEGGIPKYKYCPNCGARMVESEEEE